MIEVSNNIFNAVLPFQEGQGRWGFLYTDAEADSQTAIDLLLNNRVTVIEYDIEPFSELVTEAPSFFSLEGFYSGLSGIQRFINQVVNNPN